MAIYIALFKILGVLLSAFLLLILLRYCLIKIIRKYSILTNFGSPEATSTVIIIFVAGIINLSMAIPTFLNGHPPNMEAKTNLGNIYLAQVSYFEEHHTFAGGPKAFSLMGWEIMGLNRYAYFCGEDYIEPIRGIPIPQDFPDWPKGIRPASSATGFTCAAVGNVDNDPDLDIWFINDTGERMNLVKDI